MRVKDVKNDKEHQPASAFEEQQPSEALPFMLVLRRAPKHDDLSHSPL